MKIAADPPDAIDLPRTDARMRGVSGIELAEQLAEKRPEIGVIDTSGHRAEGSRAESRDLPTGAHFLIKRFASERLLEAIRHAQSERTSRATEP